MTADLSTWTLELGDLGRRGTGLQRPENVLAFRDGSVLASGVTGQISVVERSGATSHVAIAPGSSPTTMAWDGASGLYVTDTSDGHLHHLGPAGYEPFVTEVAREPLGSANHVFRDRLGRIWVAVATRRRPPHASVTVEGDGVIVLIDADGPRVVAEGLFWPNEIRLDARLEYAYVPETWAQRITRFRVTEDGRLVDRTVWGPENLGFGVFPDGIALDVEGNVWVALVTVNGLGVIDTAGAFHIVFSDPVPEALDRLQAAHRSGSIPMPLVRACAGPALQLPTSIGFGGSELRDVVMGSLAMESLLSFRSPVAGLPLIHQVAGAGVTAEISLRIDSLP